MILKLKTNQKVGDYMTLGRNIKFHREDLKLSQKELANRAKISQASLHYIESDANSPTIANLEKIANALGVSISELLDESKEAI